MPDLLEPGAHVVVLGAGLMGRLVACELATRGHQVQIFDAAGPDAQGSAARVAAAMLAPLAESAVTEALVVRMGVYSLPRWPDILADLGHAVYFQRQGTLIVWHRQDAAEAMRFERQIHAAGSMVDQTIALKPEAARKLDAQGVSALEPALGNRFTQGLYLPGEGQLDNRGVLDALLARLTQLRVKMNWNCPRALEDFSPTESAQGSRDQPNWVLDCRGLGARTQLPGLRGVRGEVIRVFAPEVQLTRPVRLIHPRYPLYIAPKPGSVFVIGATEIESEDMSPASVRSTLELLSAAYSVHSGFAEARVLEIAAHCRPTLPDNLPTVRTIAPRVVQINGLYRHGFMVAPALLDVVMQLLQSGESALALDFGFSVSRGQSNPFK